MEYTEGEWEAKVQKANRYWKAEVRTPDLMDAEDKHAVEFGQLIAVCYGKNTIANARLIAQAPKLYEACKVAATRIHNAIRYEKGEYREALQRELKQLYEVIKEVEGK